MASKDVGTDGGSVSARQAFLRDAILRQHLDRVVMKHPTSAAALASGLTYLDAIDLSDGGVEGNTERKPPEELHGDILGGLSDADLRRFGLGPPRLGSSLQKYLESELESTVRSLVMSSTALDDVQDCEELLRLPGQILEQQERMEGTAERVAETRKRIEDAVQQINEIHPRLSAQLLQAIEVLPHRVHTQRAVEFEELAMTLETCLLKLSLVRARAHTALYAHASAARPGATMEKALGVLEERLAEKRGQQEEEERELDRRIGEYEQLLRMVDGGGGSFGQVVEDMARVRRESDECRRDLRRLGWTG